MSLKIIADFSYVIEQILFLYVIDDRDGDGAR